MDRLEKIKKLEEISSTLKGEFIGLDSIIDEIIKSVTPWYATPEIIKRPVVVSLWGMTGTGKSSVVKRLIELLDEKGNSLEFDCGSESSEYSSKSGIVDKISEKMSSDPDNEILSANKQNNLIFVFDEFQHGRTINEQGSEVNKVNLRPVWTLIDSGIIELPYTSYETRYLLNYCQDLQSFIDANPGNLDIKLKEGMTTCKEDTEAVFNDFGPDFSDTYGYRYNRYVVESEDSLSEEEKKKRELTQVIPRNVYTYLTRKLNYMEPGKYTARKLKKMFDGFTTIKDLYDYFMDLKTNVLERESLSLDCSKSLVFIIGNLDEAFGVEGNLNPDFDADEFFATTSKVSVSDIKRALKKRFRAEQIARFGNNIIKYPALSSESFSKILNQEVTRQCSEFNKVTGIDVTVSEDMKRLLYSEGVYPTQGVRPLYTTIGSILTPLFSDIIIKNTSKIATSIGLKYPELGFNLEEITVLIQFGDTSLEKNIRLALGELRKPKNRQTRYISSVHEAGHAITYTYLLGQLPENIVSISSQGGGFCTTTNPYFGETLPKRYLDNDIKTGLGGWCAEYLVFGDDKTLGAGSDIKRIWEIISEAYFETGYVTPKRFSNFNVEDGGNVPHGLDSKLIEAKINETLDKYIEEVKIILRDNKELLKQTALVLSEKGKIDKDEFLELIQKYGGTLNNERMEKALKENSVNRFKEMLENW